MMLIMFTPVSVKSAIGRMSSLIVHQLVDNGHSIAVVRTEAEHLLLTTAHDFGTEVFAWTNESAVFELIQKADACIYQIGDNFEFHEGCLRWLEDFPGLVCLHDFFLGNLFNGWAQKDHSRAELILKRWYGDEIAEKFFSFTDDESFIEGTHEVSPMTEWICSQATGVIIHSAWGCSRVMSSCVGPVRIVPLAYSAPKLLDHSATRTAAASSELKILTVGYINKNKRVDRVLEAIGTNSFLRKRVTYRLIGAIQDQTRNYLSAVAKRFGVNLTISGEVDENELFCAINQSDVISCLRWPVLEGASASAIEAMLCGKAIIVTDTGFYAEIPNYCAVKISHLNEIANIQSSLTSLLGDRRRVEQLGYAAEFWASKRFTSKNYAKQLEDIITDIFRTAPTIAALDYFCHTLEQWAKSDCSFLIDEVTRNLKIFE